MSLHLIESRKVVSKSSRKRDGILVSVTVHALLILSVATLATASPLQHEVREVDKIIYTAPPEPVVPAVPKVHQTVESSQSVSESAPVIAAPVLIAPVVIPTVIPDIDLLKTADNPTSLRLTGNRVGSPGSEGEPGAGGTGFGTGGILGEAQVDRPVAILSGYRTPRYPEAQRFAGIEQTLNVEFVVDTLGRIEAGSLAFKDGPHQSFMNAVREALANAKFRPAEVAGHRVRQRVTQAFVFSLSK